MRSSKAHATRMKFIKTANQLLHGMDVDKTIGVQHGMDIDYDKSVGMDVDEEIDVGSMFATRTKPAMNKYQQKRLGAKKAKKLEVAANSSFVLSPTDATMYRALAARCNYLSQDRPDIAFASKELCREFSVPSQTSFKKLKRLVRYLAGMPRLVYHYKFQQPDDTINVYVDTDFAGCKETRRSTS